MDYNNKKIKLRSDLVSKIIDEKSKLHVNVGGFIVSSFVLERSLAVTNTFSNIALTDPKYIIAEAGFTIGLAGAVVNVNKIVERLGKIKLLRNAEKKAADSITMADIANQFDLWMQQYEDSENISDEKTR